MYILEQRFWDVRCCMQIIILCISYYAHGSTQPCKISSGSSLISIEKVQLDLLFSPTYFYAIN